MKTVLSLPRCVWMATFLAHLGAASPLGAAEGASSQAMTRVFTNPTAIALLDDSPASPYPSTIAVAGMTGVVTRVTVTLLGLTHPFPDDLDLLLVSPTGQKSVL